MSIATEIKTGRDSKGRFVKGGISPFKGKHHTEEYKIKYLYGEAHPMYGKHPSEETRKKLSEAKKGEKAYQWKGESVLKKCKGCKKEFKVRPGIGEKKKFCSQKCRSKWQSENIRGENHPNWGRKLTKEQIKKMLTRRIPSSLEEKFQNIVKEYKLPYKFVGNGSFVIGHYNPDFININGEKIAVEVYARYYKKKNHTDIKKWKKERSKVFKEYGWNVVYFNEIEVNEKNVLSILGRV